LKPEHRGVRHAQDARCIGGKRRAAKMTAKQRSEAARKAVRARWAKARKPKPK